MSLLMRLKDSDAELQKTAAVAADMKTPLFRSFQMGGDFPVSAAVLRALRVVLGNREAQVSRVVETICADPILATRLVSLVNFPTYFRGRPVQNVTTAINQLGFARIVDVISDFGTQKDFETSFNGRATAALLMAKITACSLIARKLVRILSPRRPPEEETLVASALHQLPELLLAYYKPNFYAAIFLDSRKSGSDFDKSFRKVFRQSTAEFCEELISALSLPKEYASIVKALAVAPWNKRTWSASDKDEIKTIVHSVYAANILSGKFYSLISHDELRTAIKELAAKSEFGFDDFTGILTDLAAEIDNDLSRLGLPRFRIPDFQKLSEAKEPSPDSSAHKEATSSNISSRLNPFLLELKVCFKSGAGEGEPGRIFHAVHCTLSALLHAFEFDRASLIGFDSGLGAMKILASYGLTSPSVEAYVRKLDAKAYEYLPDLKAYYEQKAIFNGDPLFGDDWPFACFPVVSGGKSVGVFYADRAAQANAQPLSLEEQLAITALAEQWLSVSTEFQ